MHALFWAATLSSGKSISVNTVMKKKDIFKNGHLLSSKYMMLDQEIRNEKTNYSSSAFIELISVG